MRTFVVALALCLAVGVQAAEGTGFGPERGAEAPRLGIPSALH